MPYRAWLAYGRNLPKVEALERLALLQIFHASKPEQYAKRLREGLRVTTARRSRDIDAQILKMSRDPRFKKSVVLEKPKRRKKKDK